MSRVSNPFTISIAAASGPAWLQAIPVGSWGEIANSAPVGSNGRWRPAIENAYINAGLLTSQAPADTTYGRIGGITEFSGAGFRRASSTILLFGGGGAGAGASNGVCGLSLLSEPLTWQQIVNPTHAMQLWPRGVGPTNEFMQNGAPNAQHSGYRPVFIDLDDMMLVTGAAQTWELDGGNYANCNSWTWGERIWHTQVIPPFVPGGAQTNPARAVNQLTGDLYALDHSRGYLVKWTRSGPPSPAYVPVGSWNYSWKRLIVQSPVTAGGSMAVDTDRNILMSMLGFNWAISTLDPANASAEGFAFGGPAGSIFNVLRLATLVYIPQSVGGAWAGMFMLYNWPTSQLFKLEYGGALGTWTCTEVITGGSLPVSTVDGYSRFICDPALKCLYVMSTPLTGPAFQDAVLNIKAFKLA